MQSDAGLLPDVTLWMFGFASDHVAAPGKGACKNWEAKRVCIHLGAIALSKHAFAIARGGEKFAESMLLILQFRRALPKRRLAVSLRVACAVLPRIRPRSLRAIRLCDFYSDAQPSVSGAHHRARAH